MIEGSCVAADATEPSNPCRRCLPGTDPTAWTGLDTGKCADYPKGTATCKAGACTYACDPDRGDCDDSRENWCETDVKVSPEHCGDCLVACEADQVCSVGTCKDACDPLLEKCGNACVDTSSDPAHCGVCDKVCAFEHAGATCDTGACVPGPCVDGWADADRKPGNGCECPVAGPETCNNADDDCDGTVDGISRGCTTDCATGTQTCLAGTWGACSAQQARPCTDYADCTSKPVCTASCPTAPAEACNGLDDDCDNRTDEGFCRIGASCFAEGAVNPAEVCRQCRPGMSDSGWSVAAEGTPCDGGSCSGGVCVPRCAGVLGFPGAPGRVAENVGTSKPEFVAVGDMNGDGRADILWGRASSMEAPSLMNQGGGTFSPGAKCIAGCTVKSSGTLVDVNGDGTLDAIIANAC